MIIDDGTGKGYQAGVSVNNRLLTYAITLAAIDEAANEGESFNVTTDVLTLTNTAESAVLYIANLNQLKNMNILRLAWSFGKATTTGDVIVRGYLNPTGGTLITAGVGLSFIQRNLGSRAMAQGTAMKMASVGQTLTGGTLASARIFQDMTEAELISGFVVPAGSSIGLTVQPPTGNTSMKTALTLSLFYVDKD